jgi:hypothetical protein
MPVAIASVTNTTPQLPYYFDSQIPLGGDVSSPDLFSYLRLVLDTFLGILSYLHNNIKY